MAEENSIGKKEIESSLYQLLLVGFGTLSVTAYLGDESTRAIAAGLAAAFFALFKYFRQNL